jgi:hypothetical protein
MVMSMLEVATVDSIKVDRDKTDTVRIDSVAMLKRDLSWVVMWKTCFLK